MKNNAGKGNEEYQKLSVRLAILFWLVRASLIKWHLRRVLEEKKEGDQQVSQRSFLGSGWVAGSSRNSKENSLEGDKDEELG